MKKLKFNKIYRSSTFSESTRDRYRSRQMYKKHDDKTDIFPYDSDFQTSGILLSTHAKTFLYSRTGSLNISPRDNVLTDDVVRRPLLSIAFLFDTVQFLSDLFALGKYLFNYFYDNNIYYCLYTLCMGTHISCSHDFSSTIP